MKKWIEKAKAIIKKVTNDKIIVTMVKESFGLTIGTMSAVMIVSGLFGGISKGFKLIVKLLTKKK